MEKLRIVDVDPYALPNPAWSKSDASFPAVSSTDIVNYLIFTMSFYTMEDMKAWKSVEVYNQLTSGWISDVQFFVKMVVRCTSEGMIVLDFCLSFTF